MARESEFAHHPELDVIESVIFDVGWVLVRLDYAPLLECLRRSGFEPQTMPEVVAAIGLDAHERGEITSAQLLDNLVALAPGPIVRDEIEQCWMSMFEPDEPMFALARSLCATHRVHLISNVGELHWRALVGSFALDRLGHGALPSFETGFMKPDPRIYAEAERRFALVPQNTVFIDDLAANVAAARRRGWHAIQHVEPASTIAALAEIGVGV